MWKASETDEKQLQNILTGPEGKRRQFYLIYVARTTHISLRNNNKKRSFAQFRLLSLFLVTRLLFTGEPHVSLTPQYTINLRFCLKLKFLCIYVYKRTTACSSPAHPSNQTEPEGGPPKHFIQTQEKRLEEAGGGDAASIAEGTDTSIYAWGTRVGKNRSGIKLQIQIYRLINSYIESSSTKKYSLPHHWNVTYFSNSVKPELYPPTHTAPNTHTVTHTHTFRSTSPPPPTWVATAPARSVHTFRKVLADFTVRDGMMTLYTNLYMWRNL